MTRLQASRKLKYKLDKLERIRSELSCMSSEIGREYPDISRELGFTINSLMLTTDNLFSTILGNNTKFYLKED